MIEISNLTQAITYFQHELDIRGTNIKKVEKVVADYFRGRPVFHGRIWALHQGVPELYQIKYTKAGYRLKPTEKLSVGAKELDEKLRFAIEKFGRGDETVNGLNEDIALELYELTLKGTNSYFVTILADGAIHVCSIVDFYNFVMRYDTFFKFPRSQVPVCEVPTGWMHKWSEVITAPPAIA